MKRTKGAIAVLLSIALPMNALAQTLPTGGVVTAGDAQISSAANVTRIVQSSDRAIIDWRSFAIGADGQVIFVQPSAASATLNRVTGDQASVILGRLDANGRILLINPNGIVFGNGSQVNVGGLIASTSNISNANFMAGRLIFDRPGKPGAGILTAGTISAAEGGLVALIAPHVRNDGVIVARLGKVTLAAADTFTVDLYGDGLINLALSDVHSGRLHGANGDNVDSLITQAGAIDTAGGQTVLMTARGAKAVLDNLINMSGTIKADTAVAQGGRILLLGEGGKVDVAGALSATGASGGTIDVLGGDVHLASTARVDASGANAGGTVHIGGAFQGSGDTYRSSQTTVDGGALLTARAFDRGNGGEVVVWSDGRTAFNGVVQAQGGTNGGDGGRLEVSGKETLAFFGQADASAASGQSGSLLLDPAFLNIGLAEAGAITRVLRTGTSTNLQADVDISINSAITGGDRAAGGGLTLTAGNSININDFVVTNDGAINLTASNGTVNVAAGKAVFAGAAPITIASGGSIHTAPLITSGALSISSIAGSVYVDSFIDAHTGPVSLRAAGDVDINEPIVNLASGTGLNVTAGNNINVNAQVDGRGGAAGGAVAMTAARDLNVNESIVTNNGGVSLTATNGTMNVAAGRAVVAGSGAVAMTARGDIATGAMSAGAVAIASAAGNVNVNALIDGETGDTRITAANDVNINQSILNPQSGSALAVNAGRDVNVNAQIEGRGGASGGSVGLVAARDLNVNQSIATNGGAITLTAGGIATVASGKGFFSGSGAISALSAGDLTLGIVSGGSLSARSSAGTVRVNAVIDGNTGRVDLSGGQDVLINQAVLNTRTGNSLNVTAGRDVLVNAILDGRNGASGGGIALSAGRDVLVNDYIVTNNGAIDIDANGGVARLGPAVVSGSGAIRIAAASDINTNAISGGAVSAASRSGSVSVNGFIDGSGRVDLSAGGDVNVNQTVRGSAAALSGGRNVNVNASILTANGPIALTAASGRATVGPNLGLYAGTGAITIDSLGTVTTGTLVGGAMNLRSRAGGVTLSGPLSGSGGAITINAATQVDIANRITNAGASSPLTIAAGTDINVNAGIDGRTTGNAPSGSVSLTAGQNINLNSSINTQDGAISLVATDGSIITTGNQGLFAGSGAITVQSGQTLNTFTTSTTGALALRSTTGSVNVNTAISGDTGAVTIDAAQDVNVNQGISNKRHDAPLSVTAGRDITVNAAVDGRDSGATSDASGTIAMTAGRNVTLNQSIISRDSAVSLTAQTGSITGAPSMGVFAGSGAISETSGQTLNTGITSTTGSLTLRSTGGDVNVNTPIGDTTGAVTISAASAVNVNQAITNLKTGNNLSIAAGTDLNVLAQIDGRTGIAGGAVTLTAGNNLAVTQPIATENGAVTLTATGGSVTLPASFGFPAQWSISAGNAPVSITSGGNFTLRSSIKTTGSVGLTSTAGNVTINAPITDDTGAVTITAGNGITVNHQVKSNNQPITLNAGSGGILVNTIVDGDQTLLSAVNSGTANLTFNAIGDVSILDSRGIATHGTLTIDTRGRILNGSIGNSSNTSPARPQSVLLNADGGIVQFVAGYADAITATSIGGSITMIVNAPGRLRMTTGTPGTLDCPLCDISLTSSAYDSSIGPDVALNAGGSLNLSTFRAGTVAATARSGDVKLLGFTSAYQLTALAGRDITLGGLLWNGVTPIGGGGSGPLTLQAGRDFVTTPTTPIHVSGGQPFSLSAGRDVTLNLLETLGAVTISSATGDITLNNDIGPHILNLTGLSDFNPSDLGVASLSISAPDAAAAITMQGARAEGDVTISTGGTLVAAKEITSVNGTVSISAAGGATLSATPIGTENQIAYPGFVAPAVAPGPKAPLPVAPGLASNGNAGPPLLAEIPVAVADQAIGGVITPGVTNSLALSGTPNSAGAPSVAVGATGRPGTPVAPSVPSGGGATDSAESADSASALRAAEQGCGKRTGEQADNGLDAVKAEKSSESADKQGAACTAQQSSSQSSSQP